MTEEDKGNKMWLEALKENMVKSVGSEEKLKKTIEEHGFGKTNGGHTFNWERPRAAGDAINFDAMSRKWKKRAFLIKCPKCGKHPFEKDIYAPIPILFENIIQKGVAMSESGENGIIYMCPKCVTEPVGSVIFESWRS